MVSVTLSVSEELRKEMEEFKEINWSEVARAAIKKRLKLMKVFKEFTKDSELTEEDAIRLGREVTAKAAKRHKRSR